MLTSWSISRVFRASLLALAVIAMAGRQAEAAITYNLTAGASYTLADANGNDFIVTQGGIQPAGSGVFGSFLRLQMKGNEQGYNTSVRKSGSPKTDYDELSDTTHTKAITMSNISVVDVGGVLYREFFLDINEPNGGGQNLLSLNQIQIFTFQNGDPGLGVSTVMAPTLNTPSRISFAGVPGMTEVFRMNDVTSNYNELVLNTALSSGSGQSDMRLLVLNDLFGYGDLNVVLYSHFGKPPGSQASEGGFEEWAVRGGGPVNQPPDDDDDGDTGGGDVPSTVPEPATLAIWGLGLGIAGLVRLRRKS